MNFNFGEVLTRAWQIIWKHKVLWVFGILASCGQGGGGGGNSGGGGGNTGFDTQGPNLPPQVMGWLEAIEQNIQTYVIIAIAVICIIWIIAIFLGTIGKVGLIRGTAQAEGNVEKLIFGQLFSESMPYFWRVLGLSVLLGLPAFIFAMAIAIFAFFAVIASMGMGSGSDPLALLGIIPLMIGCVCLLIPVMAVLRLIFRQAERAVVLEDMAVLPSLSRGWDVFRSNLGPIFILAVILWIIGLVIGLVIALPVILIVFPAAFAYAFSGTQSSTPLILAGICFCIYIPVSMVLNGILISYTESAWTLTFMRLTQPKQNSDNELPSTTDSDNDQDSDRTLLASPPNA